MSKNILITGSNRGIGLAMAAQLAARGDRVIAAVRKASPELDKLGVRIEEGVDVRERGSLDALAERLGDVALDWLICNAGILRVDGIAQLDEAGIREQLETNALGPLRTVHALSSRLAPGAKVGLITSRMGSIADNGSGGMYGYRMSKAALNMAGVSLARDLKTRQIAVVLLHPGFVRTDMTGGAGDIDANQAAAGLLARMDELSLGTSGRFLHQNGQELPW